MKRTFADRLSRHFLSPFMWGLLSAGATGAFTPSNLGTVVSWTKGDDATFARASSRVYTALTDTGSLGGSFANATNAHPVSADVAAKTAPTYRGTRRAQSSVAVANWTFLHDVASVFSQTISYYPHQVVTGAVLFATKALAAGSRGLVVYVEGTNVRARWSDGTTNTDLTSAVTLSAATRYTVQFGKSGTAAWLTVNGETLVTGTIGGSTSDAAHAPVLGNLNDGTAPARGLVHECVIHGLAISAQGRSRMRDYIADRWDGTPDYSPLKAASDLIAWYHAGQVTIDTGVDAEFDESGYNHHLVQVTDANQPALTASAMNSQPGTTSDGTDFLRCNSFVQGALAQPVTQYAVFRMNTWEANKHPFSIGAADGARQFVFTGAVGAQATFTLFAGASLPLNITGASTAAIAGVNGSMRCVANGASSKIRAKFNGFAESSATGNAGAFVAQGATSHASTTGSAPAQSTICERLIYAGAEGNDTPASDENEVYLRTKYGVS